MMRITDILSDSKHPFTHAFRLIDQNPNDQQRAIMLYQSVCQNYEFTADSLPEFWVVGHHHMQRAARSSDNYNDAAGEVLGWFTERFSDKLFLSDKIKLASKRDRAILVHEIVHYLQFHSGKFTAQNSSIEELEAEADYWMEKYLK